MPLFLVASSNRTCLCHRTKGVFWELPRARGLASRRTPGFAGRQTQKEREREREREEDGNKSMYNVLNCHVLLIVVYCISNSINNNCNKIEAESLPPPSPQSSLWGCLRTCSTVPLSTCSPPCIRCAVLAVDPTQPPHAPMPRSAPALLLIPDSRIPAQAQGISWLHCEMLSFWVYAANQRTNRMQRL